MIPKVTYGRRLRGLLEYLFGPGRAEEHHDQHVIAGYDEPAELDPPVGRHDRARRDLERLTALLDAPQMAAGTRGAHRYVWQCALSLPPEEGPLTDAQWRAIAERFVAEMGFAGDGERPGCRWVAVRHGASRGGNDHVHLVVTLATEDGAPVWLRQDKRRQPAGRRPVEDRVRVDQAVPAGRREPGAAGGQPSGHRRGGTGGPAGAGPGGAAPRGARGAGRCDQRGGLGGADVAARAAGVGPHRGRRPAASRRVLGGAAAGPGPGSCGGWRAGRWTGS